MSKQGASRIGTWAMLAALFTLLFPSLPGYACLPVPQVAATSQLCRSPQVASCHPTPEKTVEKKQKCDGSNKRCEYSNHEPAEKTPAQACCCSHGDFSFQHAAIVTAPHVQLELGDVTQFAFLAPGVATIRIHFATANSPPAAFTPSQIPSRAPPVLSKIATILT